MTHDERVTAFLASRNLTMEQAVKLSPEVKAGLEAEFLRELRHAEFAKKLEGAKRISRSALKALLPVGTKLTLIFSMGSDREAPRTVAAHKSYGFEMAVNNGRLSCLSFEKGETYFVKDNFLTVVEADGSIVVQYRIDRSAP